MFKKSIINILIFTLILSSIFSISLPLPSVSANSIGGDQQLEVKSEVEAMESPIDFASNSNSTRGLKQINPMELKQKVESGSITLKQIWAYFEPGALIELNEDQKHEVILWVESDVNKLIDKLSQHERNLLFELVPSALEHYEFYMNRDSYELRHDNNSLQIQAPSLTEPTPSFKVNEFNSDYQYSVKTDNLVDPVYRTANHSVTDISLMGKEGLDLNLTRSYQSLSSKILSPQYTPLVGNFGETPGTDKINGFIATGWSLNLPNMQLTTQIPDVRPNVLACSAVNNPCEGNLNANIPTNGYLTRYSLQSSNVEKVIFTLENGNQIEFRDGIPYKYPFKNVSYSKTNTSPAMYQLKLNEKLTYTFDESGRIISKENQYGDKITYYYNSSLTNGNENIVITDSYQRTITIFRQPDLNFPNRPLIITGIKVMQGSDVVKELKYDVARAVGDISYRNWNEQTGEVEIIDNPQLGYWKLNSVIDKTKGSNVLESYDYYPIDTTKLADFNFKSDGYAYSSDAEGNPIPYDSAACPDSNKICYSKQWRWTQDNQYVESDSVVQVNNHQYGEIAYSLLKNIHFYNGLSVKFNYQNYNAGWSTNPEYTQKEQYRGSTRLYNDPYALSYFGYHAVERVDFLYTEEGQIKIVSDYYKNDHKDHGWQFNEYWKQDKAQIARLRDSSRYGDKQTIVEQQQVGTVLNPTYRHYRYEPDGIQFVLKYAWTAPWNFNVLDIMDGGVHYTNRDHQITKYEYAPGTNQPIAIWSYVNNVVDNQQPPEPSGTDIKEMYTYDDWGLPLTYIDKVGNHTTNVYGGPHHQISNITRASADNLFQNVMEVEHYSINDPEANKRSQPKKMTSTQKYPDPVTGNQITASHVIDYILYDKNRKVTQSKEYSISGTPTDQPPLAERKYTYTELGQLASVTETARLGEDLYDLTLNLQSSYEYDLLGNITRISKPEYNYTEAAYDHLGRITSIKFKNNRKKVFQYNDDSRKVSVTLPDGEIQNTYYTPFGLPIKGERLVSGVTRTTFINQSADGQLIDVELPYGENSLRSTFTYDSAGRKKSVTNSIGQTTNYFYSNAVVGSQVEARTTNKVLYPDETTETSYLDKYGRLAHIVKQIPDQSKEIVNSYSSFGDLLEQRVEAHKNNNPIQSQTTHYAYDANHQLIYLKDSEKNTHEYAYNYLGGLVDYKLNQKLQKHKTYNALGWDIRNTDADGKVEYTSYNGIGLPVKIKNKNGQIIKNTYTTLNEIDTVSVSAGGKEIYNQKYIYDPASRLVNSITTTEKGIETKSETISYTYDQWKRLDKQIVAGRSYSLAYDDWDRLASITYPDGQAQINTYDTLNRLLTVSYADMGTVNYDYSIAPNEHKYKISYPNTITQSKIVNGFGELTSLTHDKLLSTTLTENYDFDGMGNITAINKVNNGNSSTFAYEYDQLNRLTQEKLPSGQAQYMYDERGNREQLTSSIKEVMPVSNELKYSYNGMNMLNSVTAPEDGRTASYTYYGDGLRATKTINDQRTRYVYLNGRVIEELNLDAGGNVTDVKARNIWGNELLYRKDYISNKGGVYQHNGHGDVIQITDLNGEVLNSYEYDSWGNITSQVEGMSNPFKYSGEIYDEESGLYYLRARYYDPIDGRFISEDTYKGDINNPLSLNLYTYVHNNPLLYTDPSGHKIRGLDVTWASSLLKYGNMDIADLVEDYYWDNDITADQFLNKVGIDYDDWDDIIVDEQQIGNISYDEGAEPKLPETTVGLVLSWLGHDVVHLKEKNKDGNSIKTPDFKIDNVLGELKTLTADEINTKTGATRVRDGIKQGSMNVIIDARKYESVSIIDVFDIIYFGIDQTQQNKIGIMDYTEIQIWTKQGIYSYNVGVLPTTSSSKIY